MKALLGDYPVTRHFKAHAQGLEFADVKLPQHAFKRVVRDLEFDFALAQKNDDGLEGGHRADPGRARRRTRSRP